ncbi:MAG TPA: SCO family protein [Vicinamibacteria bacterium]|jgi:protein SCO1/2
MKMRLLPGLLLALAPAALGAQGLPADARPAQLREVGYDQRLGEAVPLDVALRDEDGRDVTLGQYFGKRPVVLTIVYYDCPMLCTLSLNALASALATLSFDVGREFEVVTVSFDPREGPDLARAKKAAYLQRYKRKGADAGWHFLTGDEASLKRLTAAVGFRYAWDERTKQFAHPAGLLVLTPDGRISRYLYGVEYAPKDLKLAVMESGAGRIGSVIDQVVLFCYQYDPQTGRYGAVVMRIVRVLAVLTLGGLAFLIYTLRRTERRAAGA